MDNYKTMPDERLVEKVRTENQELFGEIVERYQEKLMRYANYLIKNEQKAADVVQESFIKAYINLNSFNVKKKFSSWIYRIAHNEAMNSIKKYRRELPLVPEFEIPAGENLETVFTKKEAVEMAQSCLLKMPLKYAEPLTLYFLEDKAYEEISDILRLPIGTVGTRINRAKLLMKQICKKQN